MRWLDSLMIRQDIAWKRLLCSHSLDGNVWTTDHRNGSDLTRLFRPGIQLKVKVKVKNNLFPDEHHYPEHPRRLVLSKVRNKWMRKVHTQINIYVQLYSVYLWVNNICELPNPTNRKLTTTHIWYLSFFLHSHILSHEYFTQKKRKFTTKLPRDNTSPSHHHDTIHHMTSCDKTSFRATVASATPPMLGRSMILSNRYFTISAPTLYGID